MGVGDDPELQFWVALILDGRALVPMVRHGRYAAVPLRRLVAGAAADLASAPGSGGSALPALAPLFPEYVSGR